MHVRWLNGSLLSGSQRWDATSVSMRPAAVTTAAHGRTVRTVCWLGCSGVDLAVVHDEDRLATECCQVHASLMHCRIVSSRDKGTNILFVNATAAGSSHSEAYYKRRCRDLNPWVLASIQTDVSQKLCMCSLTKSTCIKQQHTSTVRCADHMYCLRTSTCASTGN